MIRQSDFVTSGQYTIGDSGRIGFDGLCADVDEDISRPNEFPSISFLLGSETLAWRADASIFPAPPVTAICCWGD